MENLDHDINSYEELKITANSATFLKTAAKWAKFLAYAGFITSGLIIIFSIYRLIAVFQFYYLPIELFISALIYMAIGISYIFPSIYMLRFANETRDSLEHSHKIGLEIGFENLKSFFKFMGIFTVVIFTSYLLLIVYLLFLFRQF